MNTLLYRFGFILIVLLALVFRVAQLDRRVLHNDEANQMVRAGHLLEEGDYRYDPEEHHGPTLYYLSLPLAWMSAGRDFTETTITDYRLLPAIFGLLTILLLYLLKSGIGPGAVLASGALMAVSPAMVYYSRFFIQEMLLLCFTSAAIVSAWVYVKRRTALRAVAVGLCLGLMHATKETCLIAYFCMAVALLPWLIGDVKNGTFRPRHALYMLLAGLGISATLYSSFFTNPIGIIHSFSTILGYVDKGMGSNTEHVYPFPYYLRILIGQKTGGLFWSEWVIMLLGLIGMIVSIMRPRVIESVDAGLAKFLVIYTVLMTLVYSLIPYKTPWCMLSFLHGWIVLAGIGAVGIYAICRKPALRVVWVLLLVAGTYVLARQAHSASFRYGADSRNPYAYSHTVSDFLKLVQRIEDVTALQDTGRATPIAVVTNPQDAWPLPWYLRGYPNTGYWNTADALPSDALPPIFIASHDTEAHMSALTDQAYLMEYWGLRNEVLLTLYIRNDIWARFMQSRTR